MRAPAKVFVRGLRLEVEIGVHPHEHGRTQPLVIDMEAEVDGAADADRLVETLDYTALVDAARAVAGRGHVLLVERFAADLLDACMTLPGVARMRVRVEKPEALDDAAAAGVELSGGRS